MSDRNKQKQLWSDKEFIERLEKIKAERLLKGQPVKNLGVLTKEMLRCPSFTEVEKELLEQQVKVELAIKLDKRFR